ncbi:MAG: tetratricopeptide repeat protein [Cyanobacteriota bacterium]|nr:tetratricopeptide repeat protein [Cyanobacteriota bacterium]
MTRQLSYRCWLRPHPLTQVGIPIILASLLWGSASLGSWGVVCAAPVAEIVMEAMAAAEQQNWSKAVDLYQQAVAAEPNNASLHNNLGVALRRQGDLAGAIVAYQRTLQLDPSLNPVYVNLGLALLLEQRWAEALAVLLEAETRIPEEPALLLYQGIAYENLQQWSRAVQSYLSYTQQLPNALGYYRLAIAYWQSGEGSRSLEAFQRAARLDPNVGMYSAEAGRALAKLGVADQAAVFLDRLPWDWSNPNDFLVLARLAYQMDQVEMADAALQRVLQISQTSGSLPDPTASQLQVSSGVVDPQFAAEVWNDLGVLAADRQDWGKARQYLEAALAQTKLVDATQPSPIVPLVHANLAEVYLAQGQTSQALSTITTALERDPNRPEAHNILGAIYFQQEQVDQAIQQWQQAIQLDKTYWQAHRNLSIAQALKGQQDAAIASLQMAVSQAPSLDIVQTLNQELRQLQQIAPLPTPTTAPSP